ALADTVGWRSAFLILTGIFALAGWQLRAAVHRREKSNQTAAAGATPAGDMPASSAPIPAPTDPTDPTSAATSAPPVIADASSTDAASAPPAPTGTLARYRIVLREPWARVILTVVALEGLLAFGALAFVPTWLHERGGLPLWMAGATVAAFGLGGFLYAINAARLVRRLGESGLALAGGGVLALGFALLAATPGALSGAIACAMIGLGYHMLHNTLQTN